MSEKNEEKYRVLFETMTLGIVYQDPDGKISSANPAAEKILGLSLDQMIGRTSIDPRWKSIHRDGSDFPGENHPSMVALKTGKPVNDVIMGVYHPQLEEHRWININAVPLFKPKEKKPYQVYTTFADITDLIKAEETLKTTELRYRSMIEQTTDAVFCYEFDPPVPTHLPIEEQVKLMYDCTLVECNEVCAKSFGYKKPEDVIGQKLTDLFGRTSSSIDSFFAEVVQGGYQIIDGEATEVMEDGTERYFLNNGHGVIEDGHLLRIWGTFRDITDRKLTEKALRESESRYQTIFESAPDAMYIADFKGNFLDGNKIAEKLVGYKKEELIGKSFLKAGLLPKSQIPKAAKLLARNVVGKPTGPDEFTLVQKDGNRVQIEIVTFPVKLLDKNAILGIARDISERVKTEEALRESEEKFRNIVESSPMGMHMYRLESNGSLIFIGANPAADKILGIDNSQFIGKTIEEAFPSSVGTELPQRYREAASKGTPWYAEQNNYEDDQIAGAFEVYAFQTSPGKMTALFLDITERKKSEEELVESEEKYRSLFQNVPNPVYMWQRINDDIVLVDFNQAALDMTYGNVKKFIGFTAKEMYKNVPEILKNLENCLNQQTAFKQESYYKYQAVDEERYLISQYTYVPPDKAIVVVNDITERKKAEEQLKMLSLAVEQSTNSIAILDPFGRVEYLNPTALKVTGESAKSSLGRHWRSRLPRNSGLRRQLREIRDTLQKEKKAWEGELKDLTDEGKMQWNKTTILPITDEESNIIHTVYINEDITERKQAEEEIHRLNEELEQRVIERTAELKAINEELEAFAYSISHDLRAPLRAINGFSSILKDNYAHVLDDEGQDYLEKLKLSTLRMDRLITDLLTLSRLGREELAFQRLDITKIVKKIFSNLTKEEAEREFKFHGEECPPIEADRQLLEVMLTNLLSNAVKFTRGRQPAVIEFGCLQQDDQPTFFIRDNGVGFDMAYAERLFSPFQRLHGEGEFEGTGIGLAIVRRIVQRHGGSVWIESQQDKGATVYFRL